MRSPNLANAPAAEWAATVARAKALGWKYQTWIGSHWTWVKVVNDRTHTFGGVLWYTEVEPPLDPLAGRWRGKRIT
jgi:hypothetical protein